MLVKSCAAEGMDISQRLHGAHDILIFFWCVFHTSLHVCVAVTVPRSPVMSPPGSDVILDCSFSYKAGADLGKVVVTWQRPDYRVVHSFYYGQDQLALQNETYRNRTQLFPEQFSVGNASLRLKQVRGEDEGWYTCAVTNQVESTRETCGS
ncbi:CD276 antigen-like [Huso huso]|uniref:CD276 antigen-like n=1 Tax=Huso huso TaxID=61971 RepID=A0ABR0YB89_HUSHU